MIVSYKKASKEKISKNFRSCEFDCNGSGCCSETKIDLYLVDGLQQIRDHFGKPVNISSGYRCPVHNARTPNASPTSRHMDPADAADIWIEGVPPIEIAKFAESIGFLGIGLYTDFVHVDRRKKKSFWYGHQQERRETFGGTPVEKPVESVEKPATAALPVLRKGADSPNAFALQVLLAGYGYLRGMDVTGTFNEATETALKNCQRDNDLEVDGVCGAMTWAKLLGV
jgi:hypothetical protein